MNAEIIPNKAGGGNPRSSAPYMYLYLYYELFGIMYLGFFGYE